MLTAVGTLLAHVVWWNRVSFGGKMVILFLAYAGGTVALWRNYRYVAIGVIVCLVVWALVFGSGVGLWLAVRYGGQ